MVLGFLAALAVGTAASIIAPYVGRQVATATQPPRVQEQLAKPDIQQTVREAQQAVSRKQPGIGPFTTYDLPGAPAYYAGTVQKETEQRLRSQGYSKEQAKRIAAGAGAQTTGEGVGEAVGILSISGGAAGAATKIAGRGITKTGAKTAGKITGKTITRQTVKASAIGGAYEGAAGTAVQTSGRQARLPTLGELAVGAGIGAGTAAVGGYALSRAYQKGPRTGKVADWLGSSLVDPYEKPGDVLGGIFVKGPRLTVKKVGGKKVFTITPSVQQTGQMSIAEGKIKTPSLPVAAASQTATQAQETTLTPSQPTAPVTPSTQTTTTPADTPTTTTPTDTPTTTTPTEQPTEQPTITPTPTVAQVPTISSTIQPRNIPLPPYLGPPLEGTGTIKRGSLLYYNEYRRAQGIARRMLSV